MDICENCALPTTQKKNQAKLRWLRSCTLYIPANSMEFHTGLFGLGWEPQPMQGAFSGGTGTQNPIFRYPESAKKWVEGKLNKAFLYFLPNFCHI